LTFVLQSCNGDRAVLRIDGGHSGLPGSLDIGGCVDKRSTARLGFTVAGALLMALGSALVIPTAAAAGPSATMSAQGSVSAAPHPTMWVDCDAMSWFDRIWYC
jgi:hypothetical protein